MPVLAEEPTTVGDRMIPDPAEPRPDLGFTPMSFAPTRPGVVAAMGFGLACLVWLFAGDRLPGGRWIVVHIFTLGVLTTLIWTFSRHLAATLTGTTGSLPTHATARWLSAMLSGSVIVMLGGRAFDVHALVVLGSLGIMAIVAGNLWVLRRLRQQAGSDRFTWVLKHYGLAHVAFIAAAALGGALGAGWIPGPIFAAVRDAHIHLNVLGWGGLTVLATLTVLGPVLLGTPMAPDAERRSASAVGLAAAGLAIASVGSVVTGMAGGVFPPVLPVVGLALYGCGVVAVARPLLAAARRSDRSPLRWSVTAALVWFPIAVVTNIVAVMVGVSGWSTGVGIMLLVGVLAQLVLAVVLYVAPTLRRRPAQGAGPDLVRLGRLVGTRTVTLNLGVLLIAGGQVVERAGALPVPAMTGGGWSLVAVAVLLHLAAASTPSPAGTAR